MQCQIVDHHRHIAVGPVYGWWIAPQYRGRSVHPGNQALRTGFLVSGGAVDLPGAVQPGDRAQLQAGPQGARIDMVVLHRITWHDHINRAKPIHGAEHCQLDISRKRRADSVGIDQMAVEPLWLKKHLMPVTIGKTVDLVFDRGAIAWTDGTNRP